MEREKGIKEMRGDQGDADDKEGAGNTELEEIDAKESFPAGSTPEPS